MERGLLQLPPFHIVIFGPKISADNQYADGLDLLIIRTTLPTQPYQIFLKFWLYNRNKLFVCYVILKKKKGKICLANKI